MRHGPVAVHAVGLGHHDVFIGDPVTGATIGVDHFPGFQPREERRFLALQVGDDVAQTFLRLERQLGEQIVGRVTFVAREVGMRREAVRERGFAHDVTGGTEWS